MNMNNKELQDTLFQGFSPGNWGYGFKRISVELPQAMRNSIPHSFTSVGFKSEKGEYYIGLRMNVDQGKVMVNIHKYGNTTAGSIPIALTEAWQDGKIKEGDLVVLAAFGSGFTWGSTIIRW